MLAARKNRGYFVTSLKNPHFERLVTSLGDDSPSFCHLFGYALSDFLWLLRSECSRFITPGLETEI